MAENTQGEAASHSNPAGSESVDELHNDEMLAMVSRRLGVDLGESQSSKPKGASRTDQSSKKPEAQAAAEAEAEGNDGNEDPENNGDSDDNGDSQARPSGESDDAGAEGAAGAEEENAKPEGEAEEGEAEEGEEGAEGEEQNQLPEDWTPEMRTAFGKRLGQEVRKRKEIESKVTTLEGQVTAERERAAELQRQVEAGGGGQVVSARVPAVFLMTSPRQIEAHDEKLAQFEKFLEENFDGIEPDEDKGTPGYTKQQIRARLHEVREERTKQIPQARALLQQRAGYDGAVKRAYPELLEANSEASRVFERVTRQVPELLQFPSIRLLIGDMIAGEKARIARFKKPEAAKPAPKPAPKLPAAAKPAALTATRGARPAGNGKPVQKGPDVERFVSNGGGRSALVSAIAATLR